jgi:hypothetical protein
MEDVRAKKVVECGANAAELHLVILRIVSSNVKIIDRCVIAAEQMRNKQFDVSRTRNSSTPSVKHSIQ